MIANLLAVVAKHTGSGVGGGTVADAHITQRRDTEFGAVAALTTDAEAEVKAEAEAAAARGNPRQQPSQRHPPFGAQIHLAASLAAVIIGEIYRISAARTNLKLALCPHCIRCLR